MRRFLLKLLKGTARKIEQDGKTKIVNDLIVTLKKAINLGVVPEISEIKGESMGIGIKVFFADAPGVSNPIHISVGTSLVLCEDKLAVDLWTDVDGFKDFINQNSAGI